MQPPKLGIESRSWGREAQAFSRSSVNFLTAICEICCGVNGLRFLREILQGAALTKPMAVGHFITKAKKTIRAKLSIPHKTGSAFPRAMRMGEVHRRIQAACDGFMVEKIERFFVKNPSSSLKTFTYFATLLQNRRSFWGSKGNFFQKVPLIMKCRNIDKMAFRTVSDFLFGTWKTAKKRVLRSTMVTR